MKCILYVEFIVDGIGEEEIEIKYLKWIPVIFKLIRMSFFMIESCYNGIKIISFTLKTAFRNKGQNRSKLSRNVIFVVKKHCK